jgi:hypothetical protein
MQPKDTLSRSRRVIPVVLMYSLATACGAVQALPVQAPDLVNPVCMSTVVGRGATPGTRTIGPLANRLSAEQTSYATGAGSASRSKTVSVFQENVLEQVKGTDRRAVRDVAIDVTNLHVNALFYITTKLFVDVHGTVVELQ